MTINDDKEYIERTIEAVACPECNVEIGRACHPLPGRLCHISRFFAYEDLPKEEEDDV